MAIPAKYLDKSRRKKKIPIPGIIRKVKTVADTAFAKIWQVDSLFIDFVIKRDSCLIGTVAPDFIDTTIDGEIIELSKLKGQVVVLNFWSIGCQPCVQEIPDLNKLVRQYAGKKVTFISFAPNNAMTLKKFFIKHPFKFLTIPESDEIRNEKFRLISVWPYAVILDKAGRISEMWFGSLGKLTASYYQKIIDKLLAFK